ncbi:hypothetical protein IMSAG013_00861 [Clostridiales bacterium]|nr:hypothetical protein IMSAG013_00861 [Clostridiales bacterium]
MVVDDYNVFAVFCQNRGFKLRRIVYICDNQQCIGLDKIQCFLGIYKHTAVFRLVCKPCAAAVQIGIIRIGDNVNRYAAEQGNAGKPHRCTERIKVCIFVRHDEHIGCNGNTGDQLVCNNPGTNLCSLLRDFGFAAVNIQSAVSANHRLVSAALQCGIQRCLGAFFLFCQCISRGADAHGYGDGNAGFSNADIPDII